MKVWKFALVLPAAVIVWACSQPSVAPSSGAATGGSAATSVASQGLTLAATIEFGLPNTGTSFPPGSHDQSFHAVDTLVPGTAVIDTGGTVTFNVNGGVHQVAIYQPGIGPKDIDTTLLKPSCQPFLPPLIDDPAGRVAVLDAQPCGGGATVLQHQFNSAGTYLVICTFLPHFEVASMRGWVKVRPRS